MSRSVSSRPTVCIIGAGIGGMSAALDLCTRNINTTVLEQHNAVGGKMHQTRVGDSLIDSGPTVFTMRAVFDRLFAKAGLKLEDTLPLVQADILARHFWRGDSPLDLYSDVDKTCEAIASFSSITEADHYRAFAHQSEALFNALDHSFMQIERPGPLRMGMLTGISGLTTIMRSSPFTSLWRSLCQSFEDPRLIQLFARYSTYCGSSPYKAPATLMLIAHAERAGVWMLPEGMQSMAQALASAIEDHGGEIRLNSKAHEIVAKNNAVTGVVLDDGTYLETDAVIFNGDPTALSSGLLGNSVEHAVKSTNEKSLSAITIAAKAMVNGPDLSFHNVFFSDNYKAEFDAIFKDSSISDDPTIYVCAQDRITAAQFESSPVTLNRCKERLFFLMNAPAQPASELSVNKEKMKLMSTLASHGLQLDGDTYEHRVATPETFNTRCPGSQGALYGQPTHGWSGSFKRSGSRSTIKGLYLAGGGVHPGAGVPMVSLSGQIAAESVCHDLDGNNNPIGRRRS